MRIRVLALFMLLCFFRLLHAECLDSLWISSPGGIYGDVGTGGRRVPSGGLIFCGYHDYSGITQGLGWLLKYQNNGDGQWLQAYAEGVQAAFHDVTVTAGGDYVCAGIVRDSAYSQDFWLLRTAPNGDSLWSRHYGGAFGEQCKALIQTADSGFALVGQTSTYGAGGFDFWVLKTNGNGDSLWSRTFGGPYEDKCNDIVEARDGGLLVVGHSLPDPDSKVLRVVKLSAGGDSLWSRTLPTDAYDQGESIILAPDGGYAIVGTRASNGQDDILLVHMDENGNFEWVRAFGTPGDERAYQLLPIAGGGYWVLGEILPEAQDHTDAYILKTSACGDSLYSRSIGSASRESIFDGVELDDGSLVIVGSNTPTDVTQYEVLIYGTSADTCNDPPRPFDRLAPADSTLVPLEIPLQFRWSAAPDAEGDSVHYIFHLETNYPGEVSPRDTITSDTSLAVVISGAGRSLDQIFDFRWRVSAADGHGTIEACNRTGFFQMDIFVSAVEAVQVPSRLDLSVFPNPFNASASIRFSLDQAQQVVLSVFDLQGREVARLINDHLAPGEHVVPFEDGSLPSGIYFARLQSGQLTTTRKMMLIR